MFAEPSTVGNRRYIPSRESCRSVSASTILVLPKQNLTSEEADAASLGSKKSKFQALRVMGSTVRLVRATPRNATTSSTLACTSIEDFAFL